MEMTFNIFLWQRGDFYFSERALSPKDRPVEVSMNIDACILDGARKGDEWRRCRAVFPGDLMTVFRMVALQPPGSWGEGR